MRSTQPYDELVLLPSLRAQRGPNGGLVLTQKFLNGAAEYARSWPGKVATLVQLRSDPTSDMDHVEVQPDCSLALRPQSDAELGERLHHAAAVLAFLSPFELRTARLCHQRGIPLIFTSEYSPRTEKQIIDSEVANPLRRWRRKLWVDQAERKRIQALQLSAGIQCSGAPTYDIYRHLSANAMIFFDNRVPGRDVISDGDLEAKLSRLARKEPLRLVFGGRLIAMKGVTQLPKVARELKRLGVPFTLDIYGRGELESALEREIRAQRLEREVALRGVLDFQSGWIPLLKREADLFVCCHPQGDPSSTYPEVMSCGVPIAGYDNEAFAGIVRHSGSGWLSPKNKPQQLADVIARLARNRDDISTAARQARRFALMHAFEATFARRVDHLVHCSRLPMNVKEQYLRAAPSSAALL